MLSWIVEAGCRRNPVRRADRKRFPETVRLSVPSERAFRFIDCFRKCCSPLGTSDSPQSKQKERSRNVGSPKSGLGEIRELFPSPTFRRHAKATSIGSSFSYS